MTGARRNRVGPDGVEHRDSIVYHLHHTTPDIRRRAHHNLHQRGLADVITILGLDQHDPTCPHCTGTASGAP